MKRGCHFVVVVYNHILLEEKEESAHSQPLLMEEKEATTHSQPVIVSKTDSEDDK